MVNCGFVSCLCGVTLVSQRKQRAACSIENWGHSGTISAFQGWYNRYKHAQQVRLLTTDSRDNSDDQFAGPIDGCSVCDGVDADVNCIVFRAGVVVMMTAILVFNRTMSIILHVLMFLKSGEIDCALWWLDQGLRVAGVAAGDCGGLMLFCVLDAV